jgi:hypothetical protein
MEKVIGEYLSGITLGEPQVFKNFGVVPLFHSGNGGPPYLTLKEAMTQGILTISEIGSEGTVPELKVINKGEVAVLLLDGEEVSGAKQNRVLNTTILVGPLTEVVIPVSCTEQGRWSYTSRNFGDSDVVMAASIRREKNRSVYHNLRTSVEFRANQGEVWDNIQSMAERANVSSETGAMKDVFESRADDLEDYLRAVTLEPGQKGLAVVINGSIVGLDTVSLDVAYAALHQKLTKSYAMEAMLEKKKKEKAVSQDAVRAFLDTAVRTTGTRFKSLGLGFDHRFEAPELVGSALEHEATVIHAAFFKADAAGPPAGGPFEGEGPYNEENRTAGLHVVSWDFASGYHARGNQTLR